MKVPLHALPVGAHVLFGGKKGVVVDRVTVVAGSSRTGVSVLKNQYTVRLEDGTKRTAFRSSLAAQ